MQERKAEEAASEKHSQQTNLYLVASFFNPNSKLHIITYSSDFIGLKISFLSLVTDNYQFNKSH